MTNYEKIVAIINSGHLVECKHEDGNYVICSNIMNNGSIRRSSYQYNIKYCLDDLGVNIINKEDINSYNFKYIRPLPKKPKLLKVGDMVEILDIAKEVGNYNTWDEGMKEMIGGVYEIKGVFDKVAGIYYTIYNKDKSDYCNFPHYCVCLYTGEKEQTEVEKAIALLTEKGIIKDGNILNV